MTTTTKTIDTLRAELAAIVEEMKARHIDPVPCNYYAVETVPAMLIRAKFNRAARLVAAAEAAAK